MPRFDISRPKSPLESTTHVHLIPVSYHNCTNTMCILGSLNCQPRFGNYIFCSPLGLQWFTVYSMQMHASDFAQTNFVLLSTWLSKTWLIICRRRWHCGTIVWPCPFACVPTPKLSSSTRIIELIEYKPQTQKQQAEIRSKDSKKSKLKLLRSIDMILECVMCHYSIYIIVVLKRIKMLIKMLRSAGQRLRQAWRSLL